MIVIRGHLLKRVDLVFLSVSIDKEDVTTFTALILNLGANDDAFCIYRAAKNF